MPPSPAPCVLFLLLAAGVATVAAQTSGGPNARQCIQLGGPLLSDCGPELKFLNQPSNYPLTSMAAPDPAKIQSLISALPSGLPSTQCCDAVGKFDSAGCSCEPSLPQTLKAVGYDSTPTGLAGVTAIAATACKFQPTKC